MNTQIGLKHRGANPQGVSIDTLIADAPSLAELYNCSDELDIYTRSSPHYEVIGEQWNKLGSTRPLALIRPHTEAAVQAIVRFCSAHEIPFAVRSGGNAWHGQSRPGNDGIQIDMRAMNSVEIVKYERVTSDGSSGVALIGGGTLCAGVEKQLHAEGVITPTAWTSSVGFIGWACGGGYGVLSSKWGMGCDNIVGARLILASGEIVDTDDEQHKELLWAVRGAGNGTFGVITELRVKVYPYPAMLSGLIGFPLTEVKEVIRGFRGLEESGRRGYSTGESCVIYPPGAVPLFCFIFAWIAEDGNLDEGKAHLEKIKSLGPVVLDTVSEGE